MQIGDRLNTPNAPDAAICWIEADGDRVAVQTRSGHHWLDIAGLSTVTEGGEPIFLGFSPSDWFDEGAEGWPIELCFRDPPHPEDRLAIETSLAKLLATSSLSLVDGPTYWSGAWLIFHVRRSPSTERGDEGPSDLDLFEALTASLRVLHRAHSLHQAVHLGIRDDVVPSGNARLVLDGPAIPDQTPEADGVFGRKRVSIVPPYALSADGAAARREATRSAISHAEAIASAAAPQPTHPGTLATKKANYRDIPVGPGHLPPPKMKSEHRAFRRGDGGWYGVHRRKNGRSTLYVDAANPASVVTKSASELVHGGTPEGAVLLAFLEDDEMVVQVAGPQPDQLIELTRFCTKEAFGWRTAPWAVAASADGGFLLQTPKTVLGFGNRTQPAQMPVSALEYSGSAATPVLDGHAFVSDHYKLKKVHVLACVSGELSVLDAVKIRPHTYAQGPGRVFVMATNGDYRELTNLADLAGWTPPPERSEAVLGTGPLRLATRPAPQVPAPEKPPKKLVRTIRLAEGRLVHLTRARKDGPFAVQTQQSEGKPQTVADLELLEGRFDEPMFCPSPDGARCIVASEAPGGRRLFLVDPADGSARELGTIAADESKLAWARGGVFVETRKKGLAWYPITNGELGKRVLKGKAYKQAGGVYAVLGGRVLIRTTRLDAASNSETLVFTTADDGELEELGALPVAVDAAWTQGDEVQLSCRYELGRLALPALVEVL